MYDTIKYLRCSLCQDTLETITALESERQVDSLAHRDSRNDENFKFPRPPSSMGFLPISKGKENDVCVRKGMHGECL